MKSFLHYLTLLAPMFALAALGFALGRSPFWRSGWTRGVTRFVFAVPLPALLVHLMSDLSNLPPVDARLLIAFFGSCFLVFGIGRVVGKLAFGLDGVGQSVFALGGVFSNNVLLGVPIAKLALGPEAMPSVALVLVFNALTLWTLVTVSIEWARHGALSFAGIRQTLRGLLRNPIILGILVGAALGLSRLPLPGLVTQALAALSAIAGPLALVVVGLGLSQYGVRRGLAPGLAITALKLLVQPAVVWLLALALGLPPIERHAVVLLGSLSVGVNVYLVAAQFETLQGAVAASMVLSTALAALTTPLVLALQGLLG
ncbi:MAG TPA: AEC family transporter [Polyangiaceae bacterium]|nr:AEC family transporter [Polyangiaceae bacterium]